MDLSVYILIYYILTYHHSHHRDNVTAPHGRPTLISRLQCCHAQEGGPRSAQGHVVWHWE